MKKISTKHRAQKYSVARKILLTMKLSGVLLLIGFLQVSAAGLSQNKRVNLELEEASLEELLVAIEDQTDYRFVYLSENLRNKQVTVKAKRAPVTKLLDKALSGTSIDYQIVSDNLVVITSNDEAASAKLQPRTITGTITDEQGEPVIGATIIIKGTTVGAISDANGKYTIEVPSDAEVLSYSFVGMISQEITIGDQSVIDLTMTADLLGLEEVVVVGYGTQKKVNLTGAVSVADSEVLENRPVANVQQALQGVVPNLFITTGVGTGEPGAEMAMSIRGLTSIEGNAQPYVLVDNIPMSINDVDPNDIESISVLKDVASSAIYGARAAYGVILITTKSGSKGTGRVNVGYSNNFALTSIINMPNHADALSFAHTLNYSSTSAGGALYYDDQDLQWIAQNLQSPGSATEVLPTPDGLRWNLGTEGLNASAATDWHEVIFRDYGHRMKHNLNVSGGDERVNYYFSGGFYDELGILKPSDDYFKRYNIDAKISAKATKWLEMSILAKYRHSLNEAPAIEWVDRNQATQGGRTFIMLLTTRIKPTKPKYYPGTNVWTGRIYEMENHKVTFKNRQLVLSPRITLEPVTNWVTNIEFNYRTNNDHETGFFPRTPSAIPDGTGGSEVVWPGMSGTRYRSRMYTNSYRSPNIYSSYTNSFGRNTINLLVGYQHELYEYYDHYAQSSHLLTESVPSISTSVGEKLIEDRVGHSSTQSVFGRLNYDYAEKYLLEFNFRYDGSSRFAPDDRWGFFPSVSGGWVVSRENFYPLKNAVEFLKFRGSYGTIGNQNVANYLYVPTMPVSQSGWLYGGQQVWQVGTPNISSINLTWEEVQTLDFGFDMTTLNNRLGITFDWYESKTKNLVGPGEAVPNLLGTAVPKKNEGEITTRGWEVELSWRSVINDFSYGIRGILSDYKSKVTKYTNPTKILTTYYEGMELGEIWGMEAAGFYQSESDVNSHELDQSYLWSGTWYPGDTKYVDQNGDGAIDIGDNTVDNPGDKKIIGNSTPRFQYGLNLTASWKGIDVSMLWQGVAKMDLDLGGLGVFRGPANGPLHATVYEEHLDYWRDDTHPLGANPGAYYPRPYNQYIGQNAKNWSTSHAIDHFLQKAAYLRLKNLQVGYTIPRSVTEKVRISNARIYVSGENLLTFTKLTTIFDPEAYKGRTEGYAGRPGDQYPLSRILSIGLSVNF
jgi:TonB-linked SusC/RagA family outer membrane protein